MVEVTQGNVFTLNQALNVTSPTAVFDKRDNGVFEFGADSPVSWTGAININAGALRLKTGGGLGSPTRTITVPNTIGTALQLSGSGVIYNAHPTTLSNSGINAAGALENVSGSNIWAGAIGIANAATIGASGGTLTITGGINNSGTSTQPLTLTGAGDIMISNVGIGAGINTLTKTGGGMATIGVASTSFTGNLAVNDGTFAISGSGVRIGGTGSASVTGGGILRIDDSIGSTLAGRLGGRAVTLTGGTLRYIGNSSGNSTDTFGALTSNAGQSYVISERGPGRTVTLTFSTMSLSNADGTTAFNGTDLGTPENRLISTTAPSLNNAILPRVTVNGADFATYAPAQSLTVDTAINSAVVTLATGNTSQLVKGQIITGNSAIPDGTRITNILNATQFVIGTTASANLNGAGINFSLVGLAPYAAYERSTNINAAAVTATDNFLMDVNSTAVSITANKTINSLKIDATGYSSTTVPSFTVSGANETVLGLGAGAVLATGGDITINVPVLGFATQGFVHVDSGSVLKLSSSITGTSGFIKSGAGTLVLDTPASSVPGLGGNTALTGTHNINAGTLKLGVNPGGLNNPLAPAVALRVSPGATLDLNGNLQYFGVLFTDAGVAGVGGAQGLITSSAGTGTIVTNGDTNTRNWSANMTGAMAFSRSGQNGTFAVYSPQTYTGATQLTGGITVLRDMGTFGSTSSLDVNYGTLNLENGISAASAGNAIASTTDLNDRIANGAPITLRGGILALNGRPQRSSSETMGALTIGPGVSTITANASSGLAATGIFSAQMNFASLTREAGSIVNFAGQINGANSAALGLIGNNPRIVFNSAPTVTNNLIGPYAIVTSSTGAEFASYIAGLGVGALGTAGFPAYDKTVITSAIATDNVRATAAVSVTTPTATMNALSLNATGTTSFTFTAEGNTLNLVSGGLIRSGATGASTIGTTTVRGRLTSGGTSAGASELVIFHGNSTQTLTINSNIVDNGTPGATTALVLGGSGTTTNAVSLGNTGTFVLAPASSNTYTGGTTINLLAANTNGAGAGVTVIPNAANPANGLVLNSSQMTTNAPGVIGSGNIVTLNGPSGLTLNGDNTLAGAVFNNTGGFSTPTLQTFTSNLTGGTLTIGAAGVTASSTNITSTPTIAGRIDLGPGNGATPFVVNRILFNGQEISPSQATLAVQGIINPTSGTSVSGIVKTGLGALQFNAQATFTGPVNVMQGGIQYGVGNAGSRFSSLTLNSGTRLNLNGQNTVVGSFGGAGVVTNASNTDATLTVGFNGANTLFSGQVRGISNGNQNSISLTKIGAGTMQFTGSSDSTGNLSVQGGKLEYLGTGSSNFTTNIVLTGGTLTLDNSTGNVNNRLGGSAALGTLQMNGGTLNIKGSSAADTIETFRQFTPASGASVINLTPNPAHSIKMVVGTTFSGVATGATVLIRGLTTNGSAMLDPGDATIDLGTVAFNAPAGAGTGFPSTESPIRPDLIGDMSSTGSGTGFIAKDLFTNRLRLLDPLFEVLPAFDPLLPTAPANYDLIGVQSITENNTAYSIVLQNGAGIARGTPASNGLVGPNGTLLTMQVTSGGILAVEGGTSSIDVGMLQTGPSIPFFFHVNGNLTVAGGITSSGTGTGSLTKSGAGTLTLNARGYYTGATVINAGNVVVNNPPGTVPTDNMIAVVPGPTAAIASPLVVNGGSIDLKGKSQVFGTLSSNNANTGVGGTVTNTGALATLTAAATGSSSFSGQITGAFNFVASGNATTLSLTAANTYTGTTTLRGGTLRLVDAGSIMNTSAVNLNYGTLFIDQTGLNPLGNINPTRLSTTVPITMQGANITLRAGGSMDAAATLGNGTGITLQGGANTIAAGAVQSQGSTSTLTLGNLVRSAASLSTVNFAVDTGGTLGNPGLNNPHILLSQLNGSDLALTNKIIGGWAVANGSDFATTKNASVPFELGGLGNTGGGFQNYDGFDVSSTSTQAFWNVSETTTSRSLSTTKTINSLRITSALALTVGASGAPQTLTLASGGLLKTGTSDATAIIAGDSESKITSGSGDLFVFVNQNILTINTKIGGTNLVKGGGGTLLLTGNNGSNAYSGQTIVNQGTLQANTSGADGAGTVAIPGNLLINNATVTLLSPGQIRATANVTVDGGGVLNLPGNNTVSSFVFNNRGGSGGAGAPTVAVQVGSGSPAPPTALTISSSNAINSTNDNHSSTPTISASGSLGLELTSPTPTITTGGLSTNGLLITAPIHSAGGPIIKAGQGSLVLNPTIGAISSDTTNGSFLVDLQPVGTANLRAGMAVSGTGIPGGTTIAQVNPDGLTIQLSAPATATATNNLTFSGSTVGAIGSVGFTISSGVVVLGASSNTLNGGIVSGPLGKGTVALENGAAIMSDQSAIRTLHNAIAVNGDFTLGSPTSSTTSALSLGGVNLAGKVTFNGAHTVTVNGATNVSTISGQIIAPGLNITKAGPGTLVLSNNTAVAMDQNMFDKLTVAEGVLRVANNSPNALPAGKDLAVLNGAAFDMNANDLFLKTLTGSGVVGNSSTLFGATLYVGGNSPTDVTTNASSTFNGSISAQANNSPVGLTKVGIGTFSLSGANDYHGQTNVESGKLRVDATGSIVIDAQFNIKAGATAEIDGRISARSGSLQALGSMSAKATLRGHGRLEVNTTMGNNSVLEPMLSGGGQRMTIDDHTLTMDTGSTLLYTAYQSLENRVMITGSFGDVGLSLGGWTLKLQSFDVNNPKGLKFVLFDGSAAGGTLNGGDVDQQPMFDWTATNGWSLDPSFNDPNFPDGAGVRYDSSINSIVLVGVIPEPTTGSLLLGGFATALGLQRFRRRRS